MNAPIASLARESDFPLIAGRKIEGKRVNYLDSAATSLKPKKVIEAVTGFYENHCGNIHRGDHTLSRESSELFEESRNTVAQFIGATSREVSFTAGTTDGIHLIAGGLELRPDENVVVSLLDHHSNILPWMGRCQVRFLPIGDDGCTDISKLDSLIDENTRLVSLGHISNVTGAITDVEAAAKIAHEKGVLFALDAAQSVPHLPIDVVDLDVDFLVFSGHKVLGPSGVGVLYSRHGERQQLNATRLGGGVPDHVRTDGFDLKEMPYRLEAGTPNIEGVIGLGAAIEYLDLIGMDRVAEHDAQMTRLMHELFSEHELFTMLGPSDPKKKISIASLVPKSAAVSVGSVGHFLSDSLKIMVRSGTHCAHPYFDSIGVAGSIRLSSYLYNTDADIIEAGEGLNTMLGA